MVSRGIEWFRTDVLCPVGEEMFVYRIKNRVSLFRGVARHTSRVS